MNDAQKEPDIMRAARYGSMLGNDVLKELAAGLKARGVHTEHYGLGNKADDMVDMALMQVARSGKEYGAEELRPAVEAAIEDMMHQQAEAARARNGTADGQANPPLNGMAAVEVRNGVPVEQQAVKS